MSRVVSELTFLARPLGPAAAADGSAPVLGHAWDSAALTPYRLTTGSAPRADIDLVIDRSPADRARLRPGDRLTVQSAQPPRTYRITGIAAPDTAVRHQTSLFFATAEARRLGDEQGRAAHGAADADEPDPGGGRVQELHRATRRARADLGCGSVQGGGDGALERGGVGSADGQPAEGVTCPGRSARPRGRRHLRALRAAL
ncbi:hypothetical protein [Streptomyces macrolidinus]|uniref:hypothetical protein n=1 Tax=Streptomyces macrolidinus TaxID=2952607 RepID=UPI003557794A